jgi:hypothetical protein
VVQDDIARVNRDDLAHEGQLAGRRICDVQRVSSSGGCLTGPSCVAFAQKGLRIDALVTDVQLSRYISGWDVAETFRSLDPNLPVIYASGNSIKNSRIASSSPSHTKQQNYWKRARGFVNSWLRIDSAFGLAGGWCFQAHMDAEGATTKCCISVIHRRCPSVSRPTTKTNR